jgi:hypothetical protein
MKRADERLNMRAMVAAATVRFLRQGGQGVLVRGRLIVTAAHVLPWSSEGQMALGDHEAFVEEIEAGGHRLRIRPLAVEPVLDIAVLGALDDQAYSGDAQAFEVFCNSTPSVHIRTTESPPFASFPVHILAHTGRWITGQAEQTQAGIPCLSIEVVEPIEGGTSGGPVVNNKGQLVGVVSTAGGTGGDGCSLFVPRPHLAAPVWLVRRMK